MDRAGAGGNRRPAHDMLSPLVVLEFPSLDGAPLESTRTERYDE